MNFFLIALFMYVTLRTNFWPIDYDGKVESYGGCDGYRTTNAGFHRGRLKKAAASKEGSRRANYPTQKQKDSDSKYQ